MLHDIVIENFRGIRSGNLNGLSQLSVLVGPAGQGKSTVLEAIYLLASAPEVRALHYVAWRRGWFGPSTWDYLIPAEMLGKNQSTISFKILGDFISQDESKNKLEVIGTISRTRDTNLVESARAEHIEPEAQIMLSLKLDQYLPGYTAAIVDVEGRLSTPTVITAPQANPIGAHAIVDISSFLSRDAVKQHLSIATKSGYLNVALNYVRRVIPGLSDLRLIELQGQTIPMLFYGDGKPSIPVDVAGDGPRRIIEMSLLTLGGPPGIIVLEEPENFLHPAARVVCADMLWHSVERGEQVILSTHSLEFLDDLLDEIDGKKRDLDKLCVYNFSLQKGILETTRLSGAESKDAREILNRDLRA